MQYAYAHILGNDKAQNIWHEMFAAFGAEEHSNPKSKLPRAMKYVATGYDCFAFDEGTWEDGTER